jgi:large subunit ribosomal protein L14
MIQNQTKLKLGDNSGVRLARCLHTYKRKVGLIGCLILVSIRATKPQNKIKKGTIHKAIIIRTIHKTNRQNGFSVFFDENAIILVNKKEEPLTTRIFGPTGSELRRKNLLKILSLSSVIV